MQHAFVNIGVKAARRAGDVIMRALPKVDELTIETKQRNDFVTRVDREAESQIIETLRYYYRDHGFIAEESGMDNENADVVWIIDPLDGTTNFLHQVPQFCVSIACQVEGRIEHAIVYNPCTQETFTATRGEGALLDNRRLRVRRTKTLNQALIGTGFPIRQHAENPEFVESYLAQLRTIIENAAGVRRMGAAALDLAMVACGRLDAYWEYNLKPWDIAAGMLLVTEAGGLVGELDGALDVLQTGNILAGSPKIYLEVLSRLRAV